MATDLKNLGVGELARTYIDSVLASEATEHIGRRNRLAGVLFEIVEELKTRNAARPTLERLSEHAAPGVRASARSHLERLDRPTPQAPPHSPITRWQILWQSDNPPPPAMTRDAIAQRLRRALPEFGDQLVGLTLPAVGLWPQRQRGAIAATASRLGGWPLAPPGWQWPTNENEPLLFIAQINCNDLHCLPGAESLPGSGVFAFFADHDAVNGCRYGGEDFAAYYWTDIESLIPAISPIAPNKVFPSCAVTMRPFVDLPHPFSRAVQDLKLTKEQTSLYFDEWLAVCSHGMPDGVDGYASFSKLLGWPNLVQGDLERLEYDDGWRLLLQVDQYCNGEELHSWGSGGSLYFLLPERDLLSKTLAGCEFDAQST